VNPANWSGGEGGIDPSEETHCQVLNGNLCPTQPAPYDSVATYTGITLPNDQWIQFTVVGLIVADESAIIAVLRSNSGTGGYGGSHINFEIDGPLGASCPVEAYMHLNSAVQQVFLGSDGNNDTNIPLYAGDQVWFGVYRGYVALFTCHEGTWSNPLPWTYMLQGSQIPSGNVGFQLYENNSGTAEDAAVTKFSAGGIISVPAVDALIIAQAQAQAAALAIALG